MESKMTAPLLKVESLSKHFGGFAALSEVSLSVASGERLGIIGPNGSGKTTLINCISGALRSNGGKVYFDDKIISNLAPHQRTRRGIARSFQIPRPFASMSLVENISVALEYAAQHSASPTAKIISEARGILVQMGLADKANSSPGALTQVDLRKLELARALATRPRLLILDEVMAGLAAAEVDEMLDIVMQVNRDGVAIIMIEHIMRAIMGFSERVVCLDAGRIVAEAPPHAIIQDAMVRRIYLGA
jgi:branched-chain amino acid transport system ATP-binding protein